MFTGVCIPFAQLSQASWRSTHSLQLERAQRHDEEKGFRLWVQKVLYESFPFLRTATMVEWGQALSANVPGPKILSHLFPTPYLLRK
jgi:hypothetical protein